MAKKLSQLIDKMPAPAVQRVQAKAQAMLAEMPLNELRQARRLSQKCSQMCCTFSSPLAKIEKRADMYISTLRSHIEARGGELEVVAWFPDGNVKISNFSDIAGPATP